MKGQFHHFFVEIPRGDFEGTLTMNGEQRDIKGAVYMDHAFTNAPATSFSSRWYSLRAFYPEHTVALLEFQFLPETGLSRWALGYATDSRSIIGVSRDYIFESSEPYRDTNGCLIPQAYEINMLLGDSQLKGTYESQGLYCRNAVLGNLNWLVRKLVKTFAGDPIVYRYRSDTALVLKTPVREIPLIGPAFHEVLILKE